MSGISSGVDIHPAWLPSEAFGVLGSKRTLVVGSGVLVETVRDEVRGASSSYGGRLLDGDDDGSGHDGDHGADVVLGTGAAFGDDARAAAGPEAKAALDEAMAVAGSAGDREPLGREGFVVARRAGVTVVVGGDGPGLLYGMFHLLRFPELLTGPGRPAERHEPAHDLRMLDHWDNVAVHPVMGQVERGYAGGSIFYDDGEVRADLSRGEQYARLLAATGINRVAINNVNVHAREARLLTEDLGEVARIAEVFRPWSIRVHLSVNFASPIVLGGLETSDPLDEKVQAWWADAAARVYRAVPDFGGFVVKADSEGQPGPFAYGRDHADGANLLARALAPHGGVVHWRAFVYNHRQDWRDRSTDRARAAYDHFAPLDGRFEDNVIVQVKHGPMDFQVREPVSPVLAAMPRTRLAVELQVTQEYTGQQKHVCYLGPYWSEILRFRPWGAGALGSAGIAVSDLARGGLAAVSNVGDDRFWTGHPLAQANLYAFGRLAWEPELDPSAVLDEWIGLTFPGADDAVRASVHEVMDGSWRTYENYTAPMGVGFMVRPGHHYGPDVDGYEYTAWGTYHFADRDGVGVDRTRATGTGFTGQYPAPWRDIYESLAQCPDELLLFFHHVPYGHVLHSGTTVIQHIYDTHFAGFEEVERMAERWETLKGRIPDDVFARVAERLDEQLGSAREWRDRLCTYFYRKSGVPDACGRTIY
ncbi:alpha-glucuronidase [Phytoactinopolyspora halotolerans]|uniref:Alpha-glucuronidase n=1 Tax=Phytoactinopolyspora halotolerans TaxID=1981512 RepID=A0A6L9S3Y4_9ACTN|nr:alpha-glucuronidase [Phytoactinopolyspora halotolerans]NED99540.1 alpha-glucuronidase [Phytoactinopolyspora halotolerans]